jgi:ABC-type amino acid transport substrate-binding protein
MSLSRRHACALLPLGWLAAAVRAASQAPLRIGWGDYPPFQVRGPQGQGPTGLDVELIGQIAAAADESLRWLRLPWARQLSDLASGELDLVASATHAPEREAYAEYTQAYRLERVALLALAGGAPPLKRLAELRGRPVRVGMVRGSVFPASVRRELDDPELQHMLVRMHANDLTLQALRARQVDYLIEDPITILHRAAHSPGEAVVVALPLGASPVHLMVARHTLAQRPDLLTRLNHGLQRARQQAAWALTLARYPGSPGLPGP